MAGEPGQEAARAAPPLLMGVVNVTPDSFSDGGDHASPEAGVRHALRLLDEGADWVDVGGESTRPGAEPVPAEVEAARVQPVIEGILAARPGAVVSIDTSKAEVARIAVQAGAKIVNDVTGLASAEMRELCAGTGVTCVLMHMRGRPRTMQQHTDYADLVSEIRQFLAARVERARAAGVRADRIVLDPGVGFGKARRHNPALIAATPRFAELGYPVLIGASRKAFIGELTGRKVARERVDGSVGAALAAAHHGARVLRVHDVRQTRDALTVFWACRSGS